MSAEILTLSAESDDANVTIMFRNTKAGSVPRKALTQFRYWQAVETSGDENGSINKLDMTPCIEAICSQSGNGLSDVQLWIRHLQRQPSTAEMSDAEKLRLQDMYDYFMYQDKTGELYPRSLWISATFDSTGAPPTTVVNDVLVQGGSVADFITFLLGHPHVGQRLMRVQCRRIAISAETLKLMLLNLPRLIELDLYNTGIGNDVIVALLPAAAAAQSPTNNLNRLQLSIVHPINRAEAAAPTQSPNLLRNLTSLLLSGNRIGHEGAKALAQCPNLRNLTALDLNSNRIGLEGAVALAQSPNLRNLTSLNLEYNQIGDAGAAALAQSQTLRNLTSLDLGLNNIGPEGAVVLVQSTNLPNLTSLDLGWNNIGPEGAVSLAKSPNLRNLTRLNLECN